MDEDAIVQRLTKLDQTQQIASLEEKNAPMQSELRFLRASVANIPISSEKRRGTSGRREGICKHSCAHHKELMDPALWSNLPGNILQMVFARLPLTQTIHLQCLSKEWHRIAKESGFRQLCASFEPNPQMLAWVSEDDTTYGELGDFAIRLWDNKSRKWHAFGVTTPHPQHFDTMLACDGGLVCFVSRMIDKVTNPLIILVLNPLTRECRKLPSHASLKTVQPKMVQLVMDRGTMCYRVFVVAEEAEDQRPSGGVFGWVYNSATRMWRSAKSMPDLILGYDFRWTHRVQSFNPSFRSFLEGHCVGPCVYDCSKAQLRDLGNEIIAGAIDHAFVNGHLFVLHHVTDQQRYFADTQIRYYILEYQWHKNRPHWTEERVHISTHFGDNELKDAILQACQGFLVLTAEYNFFWQQDGYFAWLYDLSTCKWHKIPILPYHLDVSKSSRICELRWDAVP